MNVGYTWEKLHTALQVLVDDGPLSERLHRALTETAVLDRDEGGLPNAELRERWRKLLDLLTHDAPREHWADAVASVSDEDRHHAATEMIAIFAAVTRLEVEDELGRHRGLI